MSISLARIDPTGNDQQHLVEFFTGNDFPFHAHCGRRSPNAVQQLIDEGAFRSESTESYWLVDDLLGRIGFFRFTDLGDDTPDFDLRLAAEFRGRRLGMPALTAATDFLFTNWNCDRFEGQTRADNIAMRHIFERSGWTKEAHHRDSWPAPDGSTRDSVAYAILRSEWETGASLGLHWHDQPMFSTCAMDGVEYTSKRVPDRAELTRLYSSVGWSAYTDDLNRLFGSVQSSTHVVTARRGGTLIGLARVLSDFGTIAYLQDVLVDPVHQRRGIGRTLVKQVFAPFECVRQQVLLTDLGDGQRAFYESMGFSAASESSRWPVRSFIRLTE